MLARTHRFLGHRSVKSVLQRGVSVRQGLFTVRLQRRSCHDPTSPCVSRAGVIVSRRTAKSAVLRNRLRRRVYASLRELWDELPERPIEFVVIIHDARLAEWPTEQLRSEISRSLATAVTKLD